MENAKEMLLKTGQLALKVTPRARQEAIGPVNAAGELLVKTRAVAEDGKANTAVIAQLAEAFGLPKSHLEITRGHTSRHKTVAYRP